MSRDGEYVMRAAEVGNGAAIVDLAARCVSPERHALTVLGCSGAGDYVDDLIAESSCGGESTFFCADRTDAHLVAFAQMRVFPPQSFLNEICVAEEARGQHLGTRLFAHALHAMMARSSIQEILLDVFTDNRSALEWYLRHGFHEEGRRYWYEALLPDCSHEPRFLISEMPQANAVHERFGFSMFVLRTSLGSYKVGRIGKEWFRLTKPQALDDPDCCGALKRVDAHRGLLLVSEGNLCSAHVANIRKLYEAIRMCGEAEAVLRSLSSKL